MAAKLWRRLAGKTVFFLLNLFSAVALIFEGYNQGVLGTVSGTPGFIKMANIGHDGVVTNPTKQGGLAAAYYFGAMIGCLVGGESHSPIRCVLLLTDAGWAGDKLGRKKGVAIGAALCMIGSALMSGSVNSDMVRTRRVRTFCTDIGL